MPAFVRTPRQEALWARAKERAQSAGLSEQDGDKFWAYVNGIYQRMGKVSKAHYEVREFFKAHRSMPFKANGGSFKAEKPKPHEPKGALDQLPPQAVMDGHAMVQRPDHAKPVSGRVVAVGQHGIHLRSDDGKVHKVRHEHILDHQPPVYKDDPDYPEAAQELHRQGVPMDVEDRFRKPTGQAGQVGIPQGAQEMLDLLEQQGLPIDTKRLMAEGTPEEIEELLSRYVDMDPKPSQLPTTLSKDRMHQAPGWEKVFPEGGGRVSRQPNGPKREYAEDNDQARDDSFDAIREGGMVSQISVSPEVDPDDQEHVLRVTEQVLRSIADVMEPVEDPPALFVQPGHPDDQMQSEDVGAHYDRHGNRLEVGLGMPESIAHAYGHVVDASLGNGKYASLKPATPVGKFVDQLKTSAGAGDLGNKLGPDPADEGRRFWMNSSEVFARFFEQWVGSAVGSDPEPHHEYVSGVDQPGALADDEIEQFSEQFRALLGSRDRSGARRIRKRTAEGQKPGSQPELEARSQRPKIDSHLLEEAKGSKGEAGKRLVSALAHGIKPGKLAKPPRHYSPELAAEHAGIYERARKRSKPNV